MFLVIYLNEIYKLEQKHIYKIESLVVLQSNGLTRVQTINSTFGEQEQNDLITQDYGAPFVKKMI